MVAIAVPAPAPTTTPDRDAGFVTSSVVVAGRTVRKFIRTPQIGIMGVAQGAVFLLIFRYVFGGAINAGTVPYVDFLVPGFVVTAVLFCGMAGAAGVAEDVEAGLFDRLRSLPIPRSSVLCGRVLADTALLVVNLIVTIAIGFAVGFRIHTDVGSALLAFALCVVFGFAFDWVFVTIGLFAGSAQAAQGMSLLVFPFTFISNAYVPISTLPTWMQWFAQYQPITYATDAVRGLTLGIDVLPSGHTVGGAVLGTLAWSVVMVGVFAPIALARFRRG